MNSLRISLLCAHRGGCNLLRFWMLAASLVVAGAFGASAHAAPATFTANADFGTGSLPYSVTSGDFNGDGKPDLATANFGITVSVLLNNGSGGFGTKTDFVTDAGPISVTSGDFNGDGKPDLATANFNANTVSVLLGNGSGGFGAKTDFVTGSSPYSVTSGDFNGDGKLDLATANLGANDVSVLLGNGSGGFPTKTDFGTGSEPISVTSSDFNGDGKPDLATANSDANTVSVLLNSSGNNTAPVLDLNGAAAGNDVAASFTEGTPKRLAPNLTLTDDGTTLASAIVTITNRADGASEVLTATPSGAIVAGDLTYANGMLTITRVAPLADYQAVLRSVTFNDTLQNPTTSSNRTVTFKVNDGALDSPLDSNTATATVAVAADADTSYIVTKTADTDGTCSVGDCSLREAIKAANTHAGADNITFNITGTGVQTIQLASGLTLSDGSTTINGYSQPGANANTLAMGSNAVLKIEVKGTGANNFDGFIISGANCVLSGLSITNCRFGVYINGSSAKGNTIRGSYLGTAADGRTALPNYIGVNIAGAPDNIIGGTTAAERNVISGNGNGITIDGASEFGANATGNKVMGNYIGTTADGNTALGNQAGVFLQLATNNTIGGTTAGERNVISANSLYGIIIGTAGMGNRVTGNAIGTTADGSAALGNQFGVFINTGSNNVIGGTKSGEGNVISGNTNSGISMVGIDDITTGNVTRGNSIYGNGRLGIDLGNNGVTANDAGDADKDVNNLQNFPVLTAASSDGSNTVIKGTLNSTANATFTIDFYSNSVENSSGYGEGETYLGSTTVTTVGNDATFNATLNGFNIATGAIITATATDSGNNTSEFSRRLIYNPPVNTVPGAQTTLEDTARTFNSANSNAIALSNANDVPLSIALGVTNGTITLSQTTGLTALTGNGTASLSFGGAIANINAALNGLTFTPTPDVNGVATLTLNADNGSLSKTDSVAITITAVNDAPSFKVGANQTVNEDAGAQSVSGFVTNISAGAANESAQTLSFDVTNSDNALFAAPPTISATGTLSYTPAPNANGSATVSVKVHDSGGTLNGGTDTSAIQTFTLTVSAVNDAPVAAADAYSTNEDTILTVSAANGVLANDSDIDSTTLSAVLVGGPANGTLALNADGSFTYTPNPNFNGNDSFTYRASDGALNSSVVTVTLNVAAVNDAPVASAQSVSTDEDTAKTIMLSAGDVDKDTLTYRIVNAPANGTLTGTAPNLIYTPNGDYNGADSFTFRANDGTIDGNIATVSINVDAVNDAPSFSVGASQTVAENSGAQSVANFATNIKAGPANEASQALTFVVTNDNNALFSVQPAIAANGTLTYTLAPNAAGTATISAKVHDSGGTANSGTDISATQSFAITVTPNPINFGVSITPAGPFTNDTVTATPVILDGTGTTYVYEFFVNGKSVQKGAGDTLDLSRAGNGDKGDRISVTASATNNRGGAGSATNGATVRNSAPFAFSGSASAQSGVATAIAFKSFGNPGGGDADLEALTYKRVGGPTNGTASFESDANGDIVLRYQSRAGYVGVEVIRFVAVDEAGRTSNIATLGIDVKGTPLVNPTAENASASAKSGVPVDVPVRGKSGDGGAVTFKRVGGPTNGVGEFVKLANGSTVLRYTSRANFVGVEEVRFVALNSDGRPSNIATIRISVSASGTSASRTNPAPSADGS